MKKRYAQVDRKERGRLLDEMEAVTELHRKSLVRLLQGKLERKPRGKQRGRAYGAAVDDALRVIAESLDYLCAERLTPNLVWIAEHLAAHGELVVSSWCVPTWATGDWIPWPKLSPSMPSTCRWAATTISFSP